MCEGFIVIVTMSAAHCAIRRLKGIQESVLVVPSKIVEKNPTSCTPLYPSEICPAYIPIEILEENVSSASSIFGYPRRVFIVVCASYIEPTWIHELTCILFEPTWHLNIYLIWYWIWHGEFLINLLANFLGLLMEDWSWSLEGCYTLLWTCIHLHKLTKSFFLHDMTLSHINKS